MRAWFCVTNPYNWLIVNQNEIWGVDYRYKKTLRERANEGDFLVFYVLQNMRSGLNEYVRNRGLAAEELKELGAVRGCFVGIWKISGTYFEDNTHLGWVNRDGNPEIYPHRRKISPEIKPVKSVPLKPNTDIFDQLIFITDKTSSWYNLLYSSMTLITDEDVEVFQRFCK
jgi:predicted RNA-binding protein